MYSFNWSAKKSFNLIEIDKILEITDFEEIGKRKINFYEATVIIDTQYSTSSEF